MKFSHLLFVATVSSVLAVDDDTIGFGPYFSLGPTASWIRSAKTTLVLPKIPSPATERLALWPGMGTSGDDLIQALAVSFSDPKANCGATAGQWCVWASTLQDGTQLYGKQAQANAGDKILMSYTYNDGTGKYDQTVSVNGKQVSTLSTSSGHAQGWGTAVECQAQACDSTVAAHTYIDTTITLNAADTTFAKTLALNKATSTGLKTTDNKVFTVVPCQVANMQKQTINIGAHTFNL
ncbi:hypothetical protein DHEL01_v210005 [Diaporthe helianthi]|uniref:Uncharacterized protein n=1 Tax=Diaporthe helianthi TaxID=158607 RepID=A0A2P5HMW1_DIAHE|nr:hypothetical protein DHEL01_v210005 [Diaporthe helianthi]